MSFLPLFRSIAAFNSRRSSKSSTRSRRRCTSSCSERSVTRTRPARRCGGALTVALLISFFAVFDGIYGNYTAFQSEKHAILADPKAIFVFSRSQLLHIAGEIILQ